MTLVALAFVAGIVATRLGKTEQVAQENLTTGNRDAGAHGHIHAGANAHDNGNSDCDANLHAFADTHGHTDGDAQPLSALNHSRPA